MLYSKQANQQEEIVAYMNLIGSCQEKLKITANIEKDGDVV